MSIVRLLREVNEPGRCGPTNGQYALQRELRGRAPGWLKIGGALGPGEIPWFWCWRDARRAAQWANGRRPFVVGPNILFADSRRPCQVPDERTICDAASCRLMFTESRWYRELIERYRGPRNRAPVVLWPYPIEPKPGGPLAAEYDTLVYVKGKHPTGLFERLRNRLGRARVLAYGRFRRSELFELARRSRAGLYLSTDDRGPLALAEILLSGCPTVGLPTGAPFVRHGQTGVLLPKLRPAWCLEAVERCWSIDRQQVAAAAAVQFDTQQIVTTILRALADVQAGVEGARD